MNEAEKKQAKTVARIFRCARKQAGFTQGDICERLEISQSYLSKIENGINIPSVVLWAQFCDLTGIRADTVIHGYIDNMSVVSKKFDKDNFIAKLPAKYVYSRTMKVRSLNSFLFYISGIIGDQKLENVLKFLGVDPDFFCNYDNEINLNFLLDLSKKFVEDGTINLEAMSKMVKNINNPTVHGNLASKYEIRNKPIDKIKALLSNVKRYETNFSYTSIKEVSKNNFLIMGEENELISDFKFRHDNITKELMSYVSKRYLDEFTQSFDDSKIEIYESYSLESSKNMKRLEINIS